MNGKYIVEVVNGQPISAPVPFNPSDYVTTIGNEFGMAELLVWVIGVLGVLFLLSLFIFIVRQQTVKVIERFGKFNRISTSGLNFKIPLVERVVAEIDLRIQQLVVEVETKTKDNVFITIPIAVQYNVMPDKVYDAFYKLDDSKRQISAYVFDTVRAKVPSLNLDDVFEKKEDISTDVKEKLKTTMDDFGFGIVTALVTDINPEEKVKSAMNEIQVQTRLKLAAEQKGEAQKILAVKEAEGEAESKKLQGEGIANQRIAIAKGLQESSELLTKAGVKDTDVMPTILLTQYFDTLKELGDQDNTKVIFMPSSPSGVNQFANEIRNAIISGNESKEVISTKPLK